MNNNSRDQQKTQIRQQSYFSLAYFQNNISLINIDVVGYEKDFLEHYNYQIHVHHSQKIIYVSFKRYNQFYALFQVCKMKLKNLELKPFPSKYRLFGKAKQRKLYFDQMLKTLINYAKNHDQVKHKVASYLYHFLEMKNQNNQIRDQTISNRTETINSSEYSIGGGDLEQGNRPDQRLFSILNTQNFESIKKEQLLQVKSFKQKTPSSSKDVQKNNKFFIKFQHQEQWKEKYIKVNESGIEIYKDISQNSFETKIELCRIRIEYLRSNYNLIDQFLQKMEFRDDKVEYVETKKILSLYHEYDDTKLLITCQDAEQEKQCNNLKKLKKKLQQASKNSHYSEDYEGFFNPIGKLYIILYKLQILFEIPEKQKQSFFLIQIKTSAFTYQTRKFSTSQIIKIKQGFLLPIPNTFEEIKILLLKVLYQGWISQGMKHETVAVSSIYMSDLLSYNKDYKFQKIICKLKDEASIDEQPLANLQMTIRNMSQFSSMWSDSFANENDGKIITYEKVSTRQIFNKLEITLDRLLYLVGSLCLFIQSAWRNVYFFKYPNLSKIVFSFIGLMFVFVDMNNILYMITLMICLIILYNQKTINKIMKQISQRSMMKGLHQDFKSPLVLSKKEFKFLKWSNHLQSMRNQHQEQKYNQKIIQKKNNRLARLSFIYPESNGEFKLQKKEKKVQYILKKGGNEYKIQRQEQNIYQKFNQIKSDIQQLHNIINSVVNVLEKIASLYSWVDFKRTLYFLIFTIIIMFLSNAIAFRLLGFLFCCHRLYKGKIFYKKLYARNKKLATQTLKYLMNRKDFRELKEAYFQKYQALLENRKEFIQQYQKGLAEKAQKKKKHSINIIHLENQNDDDYLSINQQDSPNYMDQDNLQKYKIYKKEVEQITNIKNMQIPLEPLILKKLKKQFEILVPVCLDLEFDFAEIFKEEDDEKLPISEIQQLKQMSKQKTYSQNSQFQKSNSHFQKKQSSQLQLQHWRKRCIIEVNNKKYLKLEYIIHAVQSCQSRLKLEKIFTSESRTQQYQNLRQTTKQQPVIDVWLQELVINYILNTPSKFYETFYKKKIMKKQKPLEKKS